MPSNGRLPDSSLAPIYMGRLRRDAAAAWNALNAESVRRYGVRLRPLGGMSSYRTYDQQVYLYARSRPGWAARPGTSNHGWGLAVDLASHQMRTVIDRIGAQYGWAKKWSDASFEWWHIRWKADVWKPSRPLRRGSTGERVKRVQRELRHNRGFKSVRVTGYYGLATIRAVKRVQKRHGLSPVTGITGPKTWQVLFND